VSWWNDRYLEELIAEDTLDRDDDGERLPAPWRGPVAR
jgi:hypothetical protein